ncbi:MAG: tyrosine-protein phosphatase [Firmicutes bacterium]|nr:tyrosine-protein phosphatase [Bacillota bacterium]
MRSKKIMSFLMALVMMFAVAVPVMAEDKEKTTVTIGGIENNVWMTKYGNVYCDCEADDFVAEGFGWGDMVNVSFLGQTITVPVIPTYSYVDSGEAAVIMGKGEDGMPDGYVSFAVNMGNFAQAYNIAAKKTDEQKNWWFEPFEGVTFPVDISIEMNEKGGYMAEYILRDLIRTNERDDYAHLTDEQFSNFRAFSAAGIGEGMLYRSSSPINPELARNTYADKAMENAGVKTVINLADGEDEAKVYEGYSDSYYSKQNVIFLNLGVDFAAEDFQSGLMRGLRHMAENEGPYLVHCTEGKDRAGFVSALLSCFMGVPYGDVIKDYMVTYYNYYGVVEGSDKYNAIAESNIIKSLRLAFGVEDLEAADLKAEAEEYMLAIGVTEEEISKLRDNLSKDAVKNASGDLLYVVADGDSLWSIASRKLGNGNRWGEIYSANRDVIKKAELIFAGQKLIIKNK